MLPNTDCWSHRHGEHKLTSFGCPRPFTALLCFSSGILHYLPELSHGHHYKVVISQRLKADATFSKLKSKENTRHKNKAADVLCLCLEDTAIRAVGRENTS